MLFFKLSKINRYHLFRLWLTYGIPWTGAVLVGLVAVAYARLIDKAFFLFQSLHQHWSWLPWLLTPGCAVLGVFLTKRFFPGSEGSGIPQVIAGLHSEQSIIKKQLLSIRIIIGKIFVSIIGMFGGLSIGREGPTIHVGAALMYMMCRCYPRSNRRIENAFVLAGAAAGLSAAFNTPLAGVVFAIEELGRGFEQKTSGTLITTIIFSGLVALSLSGNYLYFGKIFVRESFPASFAFVVITIGIGMGLLGAIFTKALLETHRWMPAKLFQCQKNHPCVYALILGLFIAFIGVVSGGQTWGSGYAEARSLLENGIHLSWLYAFWKWLAMVASYLIGLPGGFFAPTLSVGAGFGQLFSALFPAAPLPSLIALCMAGYLSAVTRAPLTSFVIVMEMVDGYALLIPLMAITLISSKVSSLFSPPIYEAMAIRLTSRIEKA